MHFMPQTVHGHYGLVLRSRGRRIAREEIPLLVSLGFGERNKVHRVDNLA
jgi:hypothetical protein